MLGQKVKFEEVGWRKGNKTQYVSFNKKRTRSKSNSIQRLNIKNIMIPPKKYCSIFYRNLGESQYNTSVTDIFFAHLTETKSISDDQKCMCDSPLAPISLVLDLIDFADVCIWVFSSGVPQGAMSTMVLQFVLFADKKYFPVWGNL